MPEDLNAWATAKSTNTPTVVTTPCLTRRESGSLKIQNGDSVINTEQAATVQHIFYTGSRIKLVREHRGLTQQKLGEMLGYGKSSANRIAQYEMGYRSPKANRLKEIAKAMNIREEIFLMPDETPIDLLRILIWYDWEHEGVLQLATSRTANTPPGKTVSPIIYSEQLPLNRLLLDWADQKHSLSVRKITRADYLEWMLQWPPRLP